MFFSMTFFRYCLLAILLSSGYVPDMTNAVGQFELTFASIAIFKFGTANEHTSRRYITETNVSSLDDKFHWLLLWMSKNGQNFTTVPANHYCNNTMSFNYHPSASKTEFKYSGHDIYVKINHCYPLTNVSNAQTYSTLVLNIIGMNMDVLIKMMDEAKVYAMKNMTGELQSGQKASSNEIFNGPVESITVSSVILDKGVLKAISQDIHRFIRRKSWYTKKRIPYHRGYLLFGPPGCGKTSAIMSLTGEINYNYYTFDLNDLQISDKQLIKSIEEIPGKSVLLLKNIDLISTNNYKKNKHNRSQVSKPQAKFRDLVNVMNSLNSSKGLLVFMTANHVEKLDPELIKVGRIDFKQYIGPCSDYQLSQFFVEFYPKATENVIKSFVKKIKNQNKPVIPADLNHFLLTNCHKDIDYVLEHITDVWKNDKTI